MKINILCFFETIIIILCAIFNLITQSIGFKNAEEEAVLLNIESGDYIETFTDSETGDYLNYYLYIPENAKRDMPLIVFLHGDGVANKLDSLKDHGMICRAKEIYGQDFPFIAVSPNIRTMMSWTRYWTPDTLKGLIDNVVDTYYIDKNRVVITGHSSGAIGTWYMVSTYGGYFSAAVPVSCNSAEKLNLDNCKLVPIWAIVGGGITDWQVYGKYMSRNVDAINEAGGNATFTVLGYYEHGDMATEAYTKEVFDWMLGLTDSTDINLGD